MNWPGDAQHRQPAADLLDAIWPLLAQVRGATAYMVAAADPCYVLEWKDLVVQSGSSGPGGENVSPPEEYDAYVLGREIIPVRIEEHTAQISKEKGAAYQRAFAQGSVNILSCSTTFEMGVDLGELNCVFLANLPPAVSNYRQRAGRAGRRPGAAAYVLSFVSDSPHDLYYFEHPEKQ
jgi:Lhr-like helicase